MNLMTRYLVRPLRPIYVVKEKSYKIVFFYKNNNNMVCIQSINSIKLTPPNLIYCLKLIFVHWNWVGFEFYFFI